MTPNVDRPDPPYLQIVTWYRQQIKDGSLNEGQPLDTTRDLADNWQVSHSTIAKALRRLHDEGYVTNTPRGTYVSFREGSTFTPRDRLAAMQRTGRIYPISDESTIRSSEIVQAPEHIAAAMHLDEDSQVIRRERITSHDGSPVTWSITWMPADLAEQVPELVTTDRIPGGTVGKVRERTGRKVERDTYRECATKASAEAASALAVSPGSPVLFGQNTWYEADGTVLEFGEYVIPADLWVSIES